MSDDRYRQMFRSGLAPLVEEVPAGPEWDELATGDIAVATSHTTGRVPGWLVGLGAAAVVLVLFGLTVWLSPSGPSSTAPVGTTPPTTIAFDGAAAATEVETWWRLVIAGDIQDAVEMSHPDVIQFNYEGFTEMISSLGDDVVPTANPKGSQPDDAPRVCYTLTGSDGQASGEVVFRENDGRWLIWDISSPSGECIEGSPTTTLPPSGFDDPPVLDQPTGSSVFFSTDTLLTEVDVDSASVTVYEVPELAPGDPLYRLVRRGEGFVFYGGTDNGPGAFALDPSDPTDPVLIDEAWFLIPSAAEDRIWLAILDESSPETVRALQSVREVTVDGQVTVDDVTPPDGRRPIAAVDAGLIFQGEGTLEVWDPETQQIVEVLPGPFAVATRQNQIVACGPCDQIELIDLDTGNQRTVDLPTEVISVDGYGGAFSPDGQHMAVPAYLAGGTGVVLVDFESGATSLVPGMSHSLDGYPQAAWSPDGEWLFYSVGGLTAETGRLFAYHRGDTTAYEVPVTLDGQYYGMTTD